MRFDGARENYKRASLEELKDGILERILHIRKAMFGEDN